MRRLILAGLLLLAVSCSSLDRRQPSDDTSATEHSIAATGQPWVDYHPGRITVIYRDAIDTTILPDAAPISPDACAATQPNACLRERREYEEVTDAIAARFQLGIANQVYTGRANLAGFTLPDSADGAAVIRDLRREFTAFIDEADYSACGHLNYLTNDPLQLTSTATSGEQWPIHRLEIPSAWDYTMGSPDVLVASMDTGVRLTHEELAGTMINPEIVYPDITANTYYHSKEITDEHGHGTSVASLISAAADNGRTMAGIAPGCRHLPIRITGLGADFSDTTFAEGAYLARALGVDVMSLSVYFTSDHTAVRDSMEDLADSGTLILVACGNWGTADTQYPAGYTCTMSVGGTLYDDERIVLETWGSNYGPDVEIAAPGAYLTSCCNLADSGDDAYHTFGGTSSAAPIAAACAALVKSAFPSMTAEEIRALLVSTGAPVTGFDREMTRPDLANLFNTLACGGFAHGLLDQVVYRDEMSFSLDITGTVDSAEVLQMSTGTPRKRTVAPWEFTLPLGIFDFGEESLLIRTANANGEWLLLASFPVDNTSGTFPFHEDFNSETPQITVADGRFFSPDLVHELNICHYAYASPALIQQAATGVWHRAPGRGPDGSDCWYFGTYGTDSYDHHEMDMLVLPLIDLTGVSDAMIRYNTRHIIAGAMGDPGYDAAAVMVRPEATGEWEIPSSSYFGSAVVSWECDEWQERRVMLTDYAGDKVQVGFLFNSDDVANGDFTGKEAGWWIDDIVVAGDGLKTGYADFTGPDLGPYTTFGTVPGRMTITLEITGDENLFQTSFTLDTAPVGEFNARDVTIISEDNPARVEFKLSPLLKNQIAELRITGINVIEEEGLTLTIPVFIYNKPGDTNGDGLVDSADCDTINANLWLAAGDEGYAPYIDTDGDGVVAEADLSLIGYEWSE